VSRVRFTLEGTSGRLESVQPIRLGAATPAAPADDGGAEVLRQITAAGGGRWNPPAEELFLPRRHVPQPLSLAPVLAVLAILAVLVDLVLRERAA
jgi:hypothetical protein